MIIVIISSQSGAHELVAQLDESEVDRLEVVVQHLTQLRLHLGLERGNAVTCLQHCETFL